MLRCRRGARIHIEVAPHFGEKMTHAAPVEILYQPVVGQNAELRGREEHGEEPVVILLAGVLRIVRPALAPDAHRAGGAMVSIGHVGHRHARKLPHEIAAASHAPYTVPDAVRRGEIA